MEVRDPPWPERSETRCRRDLHRNHVVYALRIFRDVHEASSLALLDGLAGLQPGAESSPEPRPPEAGRVVTVRPSTSRPAAGYGAPMSPRARLGSVRLLTVAATALALAVAGTAVAAEGDRVMTPIGGGYETSTLEGFALASAEGASGPTVDLVVVPSAYGDAPADRAENLALAQERTDQVDAACDAVVTAPYTGCTATLAVLLDRADALDPANAQPLADPATDGVYILGGDQGLAMQVLADTPAEAAMQAASDRGAVVGGTSAGAAVESLSMINGYVGDLGPEDGLRQGSTLMWWGDDGDAERGLAFGSTAAIYDQHFYQRGRFGRTLSTIATADERAGAGGSPVGVGVDYGTGVRSTGDHTLSGVFGLGSAALVDYETLGATHAWVGDPAVLSARGILTHLLTTGSSYDLTTRTYSRGGTALPNPTDTPWTPPADTHQGTLVLGGGDVPTAGVADAVAAARQGGVAKGDRIVVVAVGAKKSANPYVKAVKAAGWTGAVSTAAYGAKQPDVSGARAVLLVADDPVARGCPAVRAGVPVVGERRPREPAGRADRRRDDRRARRALLAEAPVHLRPPTGRTSASPPSAPATRPGSPAWASSTRRWCRG